MMPYPLGEDRGRGGFWGSSETESTQKVPEIVVGYVLPRGRQTVTFTTLAAGPAEKVSLTGCHGVVPTVPLSETFRHELQAGSTTRNLGPLSDVISSECT